MCINKVLLDIIIPIKVPETAKKEINIWFNKDEILDYNFHQHNLIYQNKNFYTHHKRFKIKCKFNLRQSQIKKLFQYIIK